MLLYYILSVSAVLVVQVLQQAFQCHLTEALYVVMETTQHSSDSVQQQATMTLSCIAAALSHGYVCSSLTLTLAGCMYKFIRLRVMLCRSVGELLSHNADYLVNDVALRLRHLCHYPEAPRVLQSLLLHSGSELLPLVDDVITEVKIALRHTQGVQNH